jgi:hypothetical protein
MKYEIIKMKDKHLIILKIFHCELEKLKDHIHYDVINNNGNNSEIEIIQRDYLSKLYRKIFDELGLGRICDICYINQKPHCDRKDSV